MKTMGRNWVQRKYLKIVLLWVKERKKLVITSVVFCLFILITLIVIIETYLKYGISNQESEETSTIIPELESNDNFRDSDWNYCYFNNTKPCMVTCSNIPDVNISSSINKLDLSECAPWEVKLFLDEVYFTNNTITKGWLKDLSIDVQKLTITSSLLTDIAETAFSEEPFDSLDTLIITNSRIKVLRKESFRGSKLQTFEFRCIANANVYTEFNALEYISGYLNVLQFSQCIDDFLAIKNITGTESSIFTKLKEIDLRDNTFTHIVDHSFVDTPQLMSLYLNGNNIMTIDVKAFSGIGSSLQLLFLNNNKLRSLPDGVFNNFIRGGIITIQNNPWNCSCDLVWMKNFYIENLLLYFNNGSIEFNCADGNYLEVEFCPTTTTVIDENSIASTQTSASTSTAATAATATTISATTTIITPTTQYPDTFIYLNCTDITHYIDVSQEGLNRIYSHTVKVRNGTITYAFYQIESTPNFEMKVLNNVGSDYLIWINSKNSSDYGCVFKIQETVILNNLQYGKSYTICLLKESAETVAPFDCTSLTVPLEWKNSAWILNKHIPIVIGGLIGVTLAIILVTSIIMFYTIRQNPKLIKGNKRVVIVRNKSADTLVMPNYEKQQYVPPSVYTNSEGYLTPRIKMYEKINDRRFRPLNTITEKFYQDFHGATPRNSRRSSYSGFLHRRSVGSEVYEAPPLPPNHPSEKPCSSRRCSVYKH